MKISVQNLSFSFDEKVIFNNFSLEINSGASFLPTVILGPSGCGKTTLLRLIAGLLTPEKGVVVFENAESEKDGPANTVSCVFQEPRLLPRLNILRNTALPLEKTFGKDGAMRRARAALKPFFSDEDLSAFPSRLSGGQKQRASLARAFAYPSKALLMDEPFQSLDIPLCYSLMDLTLALLKNEKRLALFVTHAPREAVYMGGRVIALGLPPVGVIFDEEINLSPSERRGGADTAVKLESRLIEALGARSH
ncbi:MAG: ATP-binding cassette domain-containing protein [Treponema sp.]|jgi:NitT/TauT family transport system ATP-binding protein|nr:ATP-binding cassette domain-containing protein [Treponema sp.]